MESSTILESVIWTRSTPHDLRLSFSIFKVTVMMNMLFINNESRKSQGKVPIRKNKEQPIYIKSERHTIHKIPINADVIIDTSRLNAAWCFAICYMFGASYPSGRFTLLGYYIIWTCVEFHICKHFIMDTGNVFHWNASKVQIHLMLWAVNLLFDADVTEWILTSACEQSCACVCKQPVTHGKNNPYYSGISHSGFKPWHIIVNDPLTPFTK